MPGKSYYPHDNGGRPFRVTIEPGKKVSIYKALSPKYDEKGFEIKPDYSKLVLKIPKYERIFIGKDPKLPGFGDGNSILIKIKGDKYLYIGSEIYYFNTTEPIKKYISPIGNSDVPYPYALTNSKTYLMEERKIIPNKEIVTADPYEAFYRHNKKLPDLSKIAKNYKVKRVQKRVTF